MPRACANSSLFPKNFKGVSQMKTNYMKNNWMHFRLVLGLMGAMATAVHAESFSAEVPFAFEAAGKCFPAGVYTVEPVSGGVIMIHNAASGEAAAMIASPATLLEVPKPGMVFDKSAPLATLSGVNLRSGLSLTIAPAKRLTASLTLPSKGSVVLSHP
jgi:hypothetical protein